MSEFIRVVNGTQPGPFLNLPKRWSLQIKEWLDIELSPKAIEPIIDRWFKSLGITPKKNNHDGKEDPFDIWWEFPSSA